MNDTINTDTITRRVIMSRSETIAWIIEHVFAPDPSYWLGSVPVHVVDADHWFARHRDELPSDIVIHRADEDDAWKSLFAYDRRVGRPPSRLIVTTS